MLCSWQNIYGKTTPAPATTLNRLYFGLTSSRLHITDGLGRGSHSSVVKMDRSGYESLEPHSNVTPKSYSGKYNSQEMNDSTNISGKSPYISTEEFAMKEKVNLHFENHLQKWKRQKICGPWKAIFHILLVITVTIQASEQSLGCVY